ncbi:MAG: hypothetical protein E6G70_10525 [Alphaproteobacteria bacterium]|nr:MAG: hypothetical protein E6G70_10525 [Alphaproteobacteria bacterium]
MRIACPVSSGSRLTSPISAPALTRIFSTSSDFVESNTSQTLSPRRNEAAGVGVPKENIRRKPSLSRLVSTRTAPSPASLPVSARGAGSDAATVAFGAGVASSALGVSGLDDCGLGAAGFGASGFGASGLGVSTMAEGISFNGASDAVDGSEAARLESGSAAGISGAP